MVTSASLAALVPPISSNTLPHTQDYRAGTLMTGQLKALCIKALQDEVKAFQEVRSSFGVGVVERLADLLLILNSVKPPSLWRYSNLSWIPRGRSTRLRLHAVPRDIVDFPDS